MNSDLISAERVAISNQSLKDHDLLVELNVKITEVLRRLDSQDEKLIKVEAVMDQRIRHAESSLSERISTLESFRWYLIGATAVASFLASQFSQYIRLFK